MLLGWLLRAFPSSSESHCPAAPGRACGSRLCGSRLQKHPECPDGVTACARAQPPGTMRFVLSSGRGVLFYLI